MDDHQREDEVTREQVERGNEHGQGVGVALGDTRADETASRSEMLPAMELSAMPLDPIYAWGIVLEPVEVVIERTSEFVVELAKETLRRGEPFSDEELEERFLSFFEQLAEEDGIRRLPDAPPEMGRRILGPGRWLEAQRIRMERLVEHWQDGASSAPQVSLEREE